MRGGKIVTGIPKPPLGISANGGIEDWDLITNAPYH
jgi:hypothetical protein